MMGHKSKLANGLEVDAILARRIYCYLQNNTKLIRYVKRCISKRNRAGAKLEIDKILKLEESD